MRSNLLLLAPVALLCLVAAAPAANPPAEGRLLERRWATIQKCGPGLGVRDLFGFSLESAAADWHPERIEHALELATKMQDRDPASKTYGNFKWSWGDPAPNDRNAVEFAMQQGVLLLMRFEGRLSPRSKELLTDLIKFSVEGIQRHRVDVSYTNIYLMKIWNCIAIGEASARPALATEGYEMFDRWLVYTWQDSIHEYLSPTYYGVDLDSLGLLAHFAKREEGRRHAEAALRYFWTDIAANWFEPGLRLGGAHSRDYDYLTGHGDLDKHLELAGWLKEPEGNPSMFKQLCRWSPPADLHDGVARTWPRIVQQRWGSSPGQTATQYVGHKFSVGSAGASYANMDKPLTVNLAGGPKMPMVSFFMDGRGDPYGQLKIAERSGHQKSLHLVPFLTSVQRGPEVLLLACDNQGAKGSGRTDAELSCLLSHVVLPAQAALWIGETPLKEGEGAGQRELAAGEAVFLHHEGAVVGIRFVLGREPSGKRAPVVLVNDGTEYSARRLTCVHSATTPTGPAS